MSRSRDTSVPLGITAVSEDLFSQQVGLIRTRRRRTDEHCELLRQQLEDVRRYSLDPPSVAARR